MFALGSPVEPLVKSQEFGRSARELPARGRQPVGMSGGTPAGGGLLPLCFEIRLRFEPDEQRIKSAGFDAGQRRQFVTVAPSVPRREQLREQGMGMA